MVFRADGSRTIGAGHLIRCLSLMEGFSADGWRADMAVNDAGSALLHRVAADRVKIVPDGANSLHDLTRHWPDGCDVLVVDHYGIDIEFEKRMRGWAKKVIVVDDKPARPHDCDVLIDQTAGRTASAYRHMVDQRTAMLCGSDYAMLRRRFAMLRPAIVSRREAPAASDIRVFIAFGASDNSSLLSRVLTALAEQEFPGFIDVVVSDRREIPAEREAVNKLGTRCAFHIDPPDIAALMGDAHVALGAGGTSSWERACLGLPTLVIETADNQRDVIAALVKAGAADSLGLAEKVDLTGLTRRILALCAVPAAYKKMSRSAARLCDGLGVHRIVQAVMPEHAKDGCRVSLRPAHADDAYLVLAWQSQPGMRSYMHNPEIPSAQEHIEWFSKKLVDPATVLNIIEVDNRPAGVLRLDFDSEPSRWTISILIDTALQGSGIGASALRLAKRLLPDGTLLAEVLDGNHASRRAFEKAGFHQEAGRFVWGPLLA